jgi:putative selenium metabolism protein SsnA
MKTVIKGATIWDGASSVHEKGTIIIEGDKIEAVLTEKQQRGYSLPADAEVIDGTGKLAIPGLINAHTHLYSSLARGMIVPGYSPNTFTQILEQLWWRLDKALDPLSVRMSAVIGAMEAARCGVTTLIDHHASPKAVTGSLKAIKDAVNREIGLRGVFCYELSDRDGVSVRDEGIKENLKFISESDPNDSMSASLFGLHASFTVSDESLSKVSEQIPDGVGIHIHVAEGPEDEQQCRLKHAVRIIERLGKFGLLRDRSLLIHCLHVDELEKDLIAQSGSMVVHNPLSNMNNAVGIFDMEGFLKRGIVVGLGTDGLGENMLSALFTAGILQKVSIGDCQAAGFDDLKTILFDNNSRIASLLLGVQVGRIAPGYKADIAMFKYNPPTPIDGGNILGHLLFGIAVHDLQVSNLIVGGQEVIKQGQFAKLDEAQIYSEARGVASGLWSRISKVKNVR